MLKPDEVAPLEVPDLLDRAIPTNEEQIFFSTPSIDDGQQHGPFLHVGAHCHVFQRGQGGGIHLATLQSLFQCDDSIQDHGPGIRLDVYILRYRLGPHLEKNPRIGLVDVHEHFGRKAKTERVGDHRCARLLAVADRRGGGPQEERPRQTGSKTNIEPQISEY